MLTDTKISTTDTDLTLTGEQLQQMYYHMLLARKVDERAWALHRQGKVAFHISGIGQEACQVAAAHAITVGFDFVHAHYRDLALVLAMGVTPAQFFISMFGKQGDVFSGGRQMPSHWSRRELGLVSLSSPVADHVPQAAGIALAEKIKRDTGLTPADTPFRVTLVNLGEGATSMGDWHEGLNWAGVHTLPLVCMVENNQYAISVPVHKQMATASVAERAAAYGIEGLSFDGNDILESYRALKYAVDKARTGNGPTLLEARTYRLVPHSSDDDDRTYRDKAEVDQNWQNDPLPRFARYLQQRGLLTDDLLAQLNDKAAAEVNAALQTAQAAPFPPPKAALGAVYAPQSGPGEQWQP
ncbi:MAG: thiamine pyrophosphate-dependent dehydrogenase E1 component subunit alpha [Anaerolineae bacterium]